MERRIHPHSETYYDIYDDWELIESSFLSQYGIRLRTEDDMSWAEFCSLLSGIMPETPLGRVVSIRAEKDTKVIKNFTREQRKIRNDWIIRRNKKMVGTPQYIEYWTKMQNDFKAAYSK
ncbi:MAG: hypothetical protein EGS63_02150 [Lachnospira sp.]|jgi:hypothetical protein|nr:hypothetical protein [Lachnospira sp.]